MVLFCKTQRIEMRMYCSNDSVETIRLCLHQLDHSLHYERTSGMSFIGFILVFSLCLICLIGLLIISPWGPACIWETFIWIRVRWSGCTVKHVRLANGLIVEYMERGSASSCKSGSIVFIHGFTSSKDHFSDLIRVFPRTYHVVAIDLPGHGGSSAPASTDDLTVNAFVEYIHKVCGCLGLTNRPFHLISYSLGGYIAGLYAARHSPSIKSITMMCPAGVNVHKKGLVETHFEETGKILLLPQTIDEIRPLLKLNSYKEMFPIPLPRVALKAILYSREVRGNIYENMLSHFLKDSERYMLDDELQNISAPALVLWGKNDQIMDVAGAAIFKKKLRNCQLHTYDECAHDIICDRSQDVFAAILDFITQH